MCREQKNKGHRGAQVMLANANEPSNGYECQLQQDSPLNPTDESHNPQDSEKQQQLGASKVLAEAKKQSESFSMLTNLSQDDRRQEGALQNQARLCPELETSLL